MEKRAANLLLSGKRCFLPIINRKFKYSVSVSVRNQSISRSSLKLCDDLSCKNQFPRLPRSQTFLLQCKFSREGRWKRKRARSTLQLGSDRQTRDSLGETQGIEILWTLQASAFSSRYLSPKYPRIQTAPFRKGQVKKPRYQVSITITVFFFIHFYVEIGGMVNVPLSSPPLPQAWSFWRDHFPVSRVSLDRLRKKRETARSLLHNGHLSAMATFFVPSDKKSIQWLLCNLSIKGHHFMTAPFFRPQVGLCGEVQLYFHSFFRTFTWCQ